MKGSRTSVLTSGVKGLFDREAGPLQSQLYLGEYDLLRLTPMLESEFLQISKRGEVIDVHNQVQTITIGVACTNPSNKIPNMLILARLIIPRKESHPKLKPSLQHHPPPKRFELTRLLPLCFVKISIHNLEKKQLKFKLASGRTSYLQYCSEPDQQEDAFPFWVKLVKMLRPPIDEPPVLPEAIKDIGKREEAPDSQQKRLTQFNSEEEKEEKVSIKSVYVASDESNAELTTRKSMTLSVDRPYSTQPLIHHPILYPVITDGKPSDMVTTPISATDDWGQDSPLVLPTRQRSDSNIKEEEPEDIAPSRRRSSRSHRSSRSKYQRSRSRKPSKLFSLFTSCIWGTQRKRSQNRKSRNRPGRRET